MEEINLFLISDQVHFPDMNISIEMKSYNSDLHFVHGVLLKTPRGIDKRACIVHRFSIDITFCPHTCSISVAKPIVIAVVIK